MRMYKTENIGQDILPYMARMFTREFSFHVQDDKNSVTAIISRIIGHYGFICNGIFYEPIGVSKTMVRVRDEYLRRIMNISENTLNELYDILIANNAYLKILIEGDVLFDGKTLILYEDKIKHRMNTALNELDSMSRLDIPLHFIINNYNGKPLCTIYNRMSIVLDGDFLVVRIVNNSFQCMSASLQREVGLDYDNGMDIPAKIPTTSIPQVLPEDPEQKLGRKARTTYPVPRIQGLDIDFWDYIRQQGEFRDRKSVVTNEALRQTTKTRTRTTANTISTTKASTRSRQNETVAGIAFGDGEPNASDARKAYEFIQNAEADFLKIRSFSIYQDTLNMMLKWFTGNVFMVTGDDIKAVFKNMDDIDHAADLLNDILAQETKYSNAKTQREKTAILKQITQLKDELKSLNAILEPNLNASESAGEFQRAADELERSLDEYENDCLRSDTLWSGVSGQFKALIPVVNTLDSIRSKILENPSMRKHHDAVNRLSPVRPKLDELLNTPTPVIPEAKDYNITNISVIRSAWNKLKDNYIKTLTDFNNVFKDACNVLGEITGTYASQRSLF